MNANINLLLQTDEESKRRQRKVKRLKSIAVLLLIGVGSLSLIIFLLIQIFNTSTIKKEQDEIIKEIFSLSERKAKLYIVNNRVDNIDKVLQKRIDLSNAMSSLLAKIPQRLFIEDLEIDDKQILMTASSNSLLAIGELVNNLTDMVRKKEIISSLTLTALAFDESKNSYTVSIKSQF